MSKAIEVIKELENLKKETGFIGRAFSLKKRERQNKALDLAIEVLWIRKTG